MDVHGRAPVRVRHIFRIELVKGIISDHLAGGVRHQAGKGIIGVAVLIDAPVRFLQVFVQGVLHFQESPFGVPQLGPLVPVEDERFRGLRVAALDEHPLHSVLHFFNARHPLIVKLQLQLSRHIAGQQLRLLVIPPADRLRRLEDGLRDLLLVEFRYPAVALPYAPDHATPSGLLIGAFPVYKNASSRLPSRVAINGTFISQFGKTKRGKKACDGFSMKSLLGAERLAARHGGAAGRGSPQRGVRRASSLARSPSAPAVETPQSKYDGHPIKGKR